MGSNQHFLHRILLVATLFHVFSLSFAEYPRQSAWERLHARTASTNLLTNRVGRPNSNPEYYRGDKPDAPAIPESSDEVKPSKVDNVVPSDAENVKLSDVDNVKPSIVESETAQEHSDGAIESARSFRAAVAASIVASGPQPGEGTTLDDDASGGFPLEGETSQADEAPPNPYGQGVDQYDKQGGFPPNPYDNQRQAQTRPDTHEEEEKDIYSGPDDVGGYPNPDVTAPGEGQFVRGGGENSPNTEGGGQDGSEGSERPVVSEGGEDGHFFQKNAVRSGDKEDEDNAATGGSGDEGLGVGGSGGGDDDGSKVGGESGKHVGDTEGVVSGEEETKVDEGGEPEVTEKAIGSDDDDEKSETRLFSSDMCVENIQPLMGKRTKHVCHLKTVPTQTDSSFKFSIYDPPVAPVCKVITAYNRAFEHPCSGGVGNTNTFQKYHCELGAMEVYGEEPDWIMCEFESDDGSTVMPMQTIYVYPPTSRYIPQLRFSQIVVYDTLDGEDTIIGAHSMSAFEKKYQGQSGPDTIFQIDVAHNAELKICVEGLKGCKSPKVTISSGEDEKCDNAKGIRCFTLDVAHELAAGKMTLVEIKLGVELYQNSGETWTKDKEFKIEVNVNQAPTPEPTPVPMASPEDEPEDSNVDVIGDGDENGVENPGEGLGESPDGNGGENPDEDGGRDGPGDGDDVDGGRGSFEGDDSVVEGGGGGGDDSVVEGGGGGGDDSANKKVKGVDEKYEGDDEPSWASNLLWFAFLVSGLVGVVYFGAKRAGIDLNKVLGRTQLPPSVSHGGGAAENHSAFLDIEEGDNGGQPPSQQAPNQPELFGERDAMPILKECLAEKRVPKRKVTSILENFAESGSTAIGDLEAFSSSDWKEHGVTLSLRVYIKKRISALRREHEDISNGAAMGDSDAAEEDDYDDYGDEELDPDSISASPGRRRSEESGQGESGGDDDDDYSSSSRQSKATRGSSRGGGARNAKKKSTRRPASDDEAEIVDDEDDWF